MNKLPNNYAVYLNNERAEALARYREGRSDTLGDILMAGIEAGGTSARDKIMALSADDIEQFGQDNFYLSYGGSSIPLIRGTNFWWCKNWDSFRVLGMNENYTKHEDVPELYAGTRRNCELVAAHLNSILREAEEASDE